MIDPLRPYWPTNRSIAGILVRGLCLLSAAGAVLWGKPRSFVLLIILATAVAQASLLVFDWMELRRAGRAGLIAVSIIGSVFLALVLVLLIEGRAVLVLTVR